MKKAMTVLLATVCVLSALTMGGCGSSFGNDDSYLDQFEKTTDASRPSWEQRDDEEITIDWFIDVPWMSWPSYGYDDVSQVIKEKTGVNIRFRTALQDDGSELQTLISSGTLPDVISVRTDYPQSSQLADQGYLFSLNKLMDMFAPSMKTTWLEQQKDVFGFFSRADGQTYGVPSYAYSEYYTADMALESNGGILVREDWYNEVAEAGIDMTSPAGFIEGCRYVAEHHDECIPVQLDAFDSTGNPSVTWLMQYFAVPFEKEDGSYNYQYTDSRFEEVLTFLNDLTTAGYIKKGNFSAKSDAISTTIASQKVFVSMVTPQVYQQAFYSLYEKGITYIPLVLRNAKGEDPVLQDITGYGFLLNMITRNAKRPDRIIKLFDFLTSEEGQRLVCYGKEGVAWNWEDDTKTHIKYTDQYLLDQDAGDVGRYGICACQMFLNYVYMQKIAPTTSEGKARGQIYIDNLKKPLVPYCYTYPSIKIDPAVEGYNDYSAKNASVQSTLARYLPIMIDTSSREKALEYYHNAIADMERRGLDVVTNFLGACYEKTKTLLGKQSFWPTYSPDYTSPLTQDGQPIGPNGDFSYWNYVTHGEGGENA